MATHQPTYDQIIMSKEHRNIGKCFKGRVELFNFLCGNTLSTLLEGHSNSQNFIAREFMRANAEKYFFKNDDNVLTSEQ